MEKRSEHRSKKTNRDGVTFLALLTVLGFLGGITSCSLSGAAANTPLPAVPTISTIAFSTPHCGTQKLVIDSTSYQIQALPSAANGSLNIPGGGSGVAYWVEGTETNYVFVLSPTPENLSLQTSLSAGKTAKVTWSDCNSTVYSLLAPTQLPPDISTMFTQSAPGITILVQGNSTATGFVVRGELGEQQISTVNTPEVSQIQAEISLLKTTTSLDGKTIQIGISILNNGGSSFTISNGNVSLTAAGGEAVTLKGSTPSLPKEVKAGTTETIYFIFLRPSSQSATLKILDVEYEIEGY